MKKILFALSILGLMFLFGCSEAMEYTTTTAYQNINLTKVITYNFEDLEFSDISSEDLLNYVVDDFEDYKLMLILADDLRLIPSLLDSSNGVIDTLEELSDASSISLKTLLTYSATELNTLASENDITLTVDDIVGFMDLLTIKEQLPTSIGKSREDYLELRLGRDLTIEEKNGIIDFQEAYIELLYISEYDITNKTFLELIDDLDSVGIVYPQENFDSIEIGFDLIIGLMG